MVVCAAIKCRFIEQNDVIIPCVRHGYGLDTIRRLCENNGMERPIETVQGFLDDSNKFFDRKQAFTEATRLHQLPPTVMWKKLDNNEDELYSEDLY